MTNNVKAHIRATTDPQNNQTVGGALCDAPCSASFLPSSDYAAFTEKVRNIVCDPNKGIKGHSFVATNSKDTWGEDIIGDTIQWLKEKFGVDDVEVREQKVYVNGERVGSVTDDTTWLIPNT